MNPSEIPLFALADRRLSWLDQRVSALAGNVANADTPGFRPRDLAPFAATLGGLGGPLAPLRTNPLHLAGSLGGGLGLVTTSDGERAPDGNAVSLDAEMMRMSETDAAHELVGQIYKKYIGMLKTAAGR